MYKTSQTYLRLAFMSIAIYSVKIFLNFGKIGIKEKTIMENKLVIYNTLKRKKEEFVPLHARMWVCMYVAPTVYGDAHLGHARPAITFDVLFRYLQHLGYKVRYVRNITDGPSGA